MRPDRLFTAMLTLGLLTASSQLALSGVNYEWGGSGSYFYDSTGNYLDYNAGTSTALGNFTWELGSFEAGFTPNGTNLDQYAAKWRPFDGAKNSWASPGYVGNWSPGTSDAGVSGLGSLEMNANGTSSNSILAGSHNFQGEQGYIWVFNSKSTGAEWGLVTSADWIFDANGTYGPSTRWRLYSSNTSTFKSATDAVVGAVNNPFLNDVGAGTITTPGYTRPLNFEFIQIQTAVVNFVTVPEPSGSMLLGSLSLLALLRRRRS